ncbi:hypothetical protein RRG08_048530 [Elysia crispata]|uniref:Uncharacterized protein n=1 Tax=Elysia crispata TaxID=231223 RepID=A0AAE1B6E1_9GAST|nr:hypothetical protein RRG08_048530 [Elysia crispata]
MSGSGRRADWGERRQKNQTYHEVQLDDIKSRQSERVYVSPTPTIVSTRVGTAENPSALSLMSIWPCKQLIKFCERKGVRSHSNLKPQQGVT